MFPENTGIATSRKVLFSRRKRKGRRKNTKTRPRARENVCGVNEMCFRDRPACFSLPRPLAHVGGLKARTCYTWTKLLLTFKTQFGGRTFPARKGVFVKNFKAHNYETSERDSSGCSNISLSTIGTSTTAL